SLSGLGFDTAWDSAFNATTTWAAFATNWDSAFNSTSTWWAFASLWDTSFIATTTWSGNLTVDGTINATAIDATDLTIEVTDDWLGTWQGSSPNTFFGWQSTTTDIVGTALLGQSPFITPTSTSSVYLPKDLVVEDNVSVFGNATTSGWFNIGTTDVVATLGGLIGAGDLYVGDSATITNSLIVNSGVVGIGTASPSSGYKLDIAGNAIISNGILFVDGAGAGVVIDDRTTGRDWQLYGTGDIFNLWNGSSNVFSIDASGNATVTNHFTADATLYVKDSKVGIGIDAPSYVFHVDGSTNSPIVAVSDGLGNLLAQIGHSDTLNEGGYLNLYETAGDGGGVGTRLVGGPGSSYFLNNLGIGTTTPAYNLVVDSNVLITNRLESLRASTTAELEVGTNMAIAGAKVQTGYGLNIGSTEATTWPIFDDSTARLTPAGTWTNASSWSWLKNIVNQPEGYLEKFRQLPIYEWQYRDEEIDGMNRYETDKFIHASPFLDDFNEAFGIGFKDGVNVQDWVGMTMIGLKELDQVVLDMADEINQIKQDLSLIVSSSTSSSTEELVVSEEPTTSPDLDVDTLIVRQAATFYGTITVLGDALFEHNVVFNQDVEIKGKLYAGKDTAGTAVIPANATSTEILFETPYEVMPKITLSLQDAKSVFYGTKNKSTKGFKIVLTEPFSEDLTFDWIALAVKDTNSLPPVIDDLIISSNTVGFDIPVELWAQVTDPDTAEADLTYSWSFEPSVGELSGDSGLVYWRVTSGLNKDTDVTIIVTVSDGENSTSGSSVVRVLVSGKEEAEEAEPEFVTPPDLITETKPEAAPAATTTPEIVIEPEPEEATTTPEVVLDEAENKKSPEMVQDQDESEDESVDISTVNN
ncbi:tail fiber domain-containing protein, partial [Candidatus Falkowbacteria bacterium]|nr:tail fiber domain-containing protein [Candidatus Falkowbacteria bacterium]